MRNLGITNLETLKNSYTQEFPETTDGMKRVVTNFTFIENSSLTITADLQQKSNEDEYTVMGYTIPKVDLTGAAITIDITNFLPAYKTEIAGVLSSDKTVTFDLGWVNDFAKDQIWEYVRNSSNKTIQAAIGLIAAMKYKGDSSKVTAADVFNPLLTLSGIDRTWETFDIADELHVDAIASIQIVTGIEGISDFYIYNVNNGGAAPGWEVDFKGRTVTHHSAHSAATPEPATLAVFGLGIAGLAVLRRRKK